MKTYLAILLIIIVAIVVWELIAARRPTAQAADEMDAWRERHERRPNDADAVTKSREAGLYDVQENELPWDI